MYPQLVKMITHGQEHIGYKGGQLQPAYKGVDQWTAATYRSLLISSHLGSSTQNDPRKSSPSCTRSSCSRSRPEAAAKVQLAMHQLRAYARQAKRRNQSVAIIYLDLTEAFYTVMREAALGVNQATQSLHMCCRGSTFPIVPCTTSTAFCRNLQRFSKQVSKKLIKDVGRLCTQAHTSG